MDRAKRIAKTILLVLVRFIEIAIRTYVFLIHPIIFVLVSLLLAAFKGPKSKPTYEEHLNDWWCTLIINFIDKYEELTDWLDKKLLNKEEEQL